MKRILTLVALVGLGCGGSPRSKPVFINQTPQSDAFLMIQWQAAQAEVSAGGQDLTRISTIERDTPATVLPPDPRANGVQPNGLAVVSQPDDRPGEVACPQPCDVGYSVAYSLWGRRVTYAASWDQHPEALAEWLRYEFASQILWQLGYDVRWR